MIWSDHMKPTTEAQQQPLRPIFGHFLPLRALWNGDADRHPLFPSEVSARWFLRNHLTRLIEREAALKHRGAWVLDLEKVEILAREVAAEAAKASIRTVAE
jgi:hypothetical protein